MSNNNNNNDMNLINKKVEEQTQTFISNKSISNKKSALIKSYMVCDQKNIFI